jgi:broad specificity phosphatase PhoE
MHLIVIRHAETEENRHGIIQGQRHGQISELGKRQSKIVADALKHEAIDAIFSSDLKRCIDTAEPLQMIYNQVPFSLSPALREFSYGRMQGLQLGRLIKIVPKINFVLHFRLPGGESYKQVHARLTGFLNQLYELYPNGTVLLVTHGGPIRIIRQLLDNKVKRTTPQIINNCSVWRLTMTKPL